jgi:hypothetical protein
MNGLFIRPNHRVEGIQLALQLPGVGDIVCKESRSLPPGSELMSTGGAAASVSPPAVSRPRGWATTWCRSASVGNRSREIAHAERKARLESKATRVRKRALSMTGSIPDLPVWVGAEPPGVELRACDGPREPVKASQGRQMRQDSPLFTEGAPPRPS